MHVSAHSPGDMEEQRTCLPIYKLVLLLHYSSSAAAAVMSMWRVCAHWIRLNGETGPSTGWMSCADRARESAVYGKAVAQGIHSSADVVWMK